MSERDFQLKKSASQWNKGKGCDTFGPLGPWLVTTDEIKDVQNLDMWLDVNGVRKQTGNTKTMIFTVAELVADVSRYMTLLPGDVITTGTPPGVGMGMKPQQWLQGRRRGHARHRGPGRAEAEGRPVQGQALSACVHGERPAPRRGLLRAWRPALVALGHAASGRRTPPRRRTRRSPCT